MLVFLFIYLFFFWHCSILVIFYWYLVLFFYIFLSISEIFFLVSLGRFIPLFFPGQTISRIGTQWHLNPPLSKGNSRCLWLSPILQLRWWTERSRDGLFFFLPACRGGITNTYSRMIESGIQSGLWLPIPAFLFWEDGIFSFRSWTFLVPRVRFGGCSIPSQLAHFPTSGVNIVFVTQILSPASDTVCLEPSCTIDSIRSLRIRSRKCVPMAFTSQIWLA